MERETGLEPATLSLATRCSSTELLPHIDANYTRFGGRGETRTPTGKAHQILSLACLPIPPLARVVVPRGGFEPPTPGFSVQCSTTELPRRMAGLTGLEPATSSVTG